MIILKYFFNITIFYIFNTLFYKYLEKSYKNIYNKNKLRYITKNIVKSIILFVLLLILYLLFFFILYVYLYLHLNLNFYHLHYTKV